MTAQSPHSSAASAAGDASIPRRALVLGRADEAEEMAAALRRLGVAVAVAVLEAAPDFDRLGDICAEFRPDVAVPIGPVEDPGVLDLVESFGIAIAPSRAGIDIGARRDAQLRFASEELGLPVARYAMARSSVEVEQSAGVLGYPCIVSPAEAGAGESSVVLSAGDIPGAYGRAGGGDVVVETRVSADVEIVMLAVAGVYFESGERRPVIRFCEPIGVARGPEGYVRETWQPQETTEGEYDAARSVAARVARALGGRGVYAVRMLVRRGDVYFAGVGTGPSATGVVTLSSQLFDQWALHARAIVGAPSEVTMVSPAATSVLEASVPVENVGAALDVAESAVWNCELSSEHSAWRYGAALATADDILEARERARAVADRALG
ncbi:ATP-grasp domain-containing protein [Dietzia sp.]|uniref:ATP-grasp domain-containing protein n=1 Tax=Dietzia sp. TaxID=1871616 RepID=UPI002FD9DBBE